MNKHKIYIYFKVPNSANTYDYADGGFLVEQDYRPMVGDVIVEIQDGYPDFAVVIETLILLKEQLSPSDDASYWHAYCDSVGFDFSLQPYYGKSGDIAKLAAHAIDQRANHINKYGTIAKEYDGYKDRCKDGVKDKIRKQSD